MKTLLFIFSSLAACTAFPAFAQLGPAGVPGAPGLAPAPAAPNATNHATSKTETPAKVLAACAKSKNVEQCVARQETRRKARAACRSKLKRGIQAVRQQLLEPQEEITTLDPAVSSRLAASFRPSGRTPAYRPDWSREERGFRTPVRRTSARICPRSCR